MFRSLRHLRHVSFKLGPPAIWRTEESLHRYLYRSIATTTATPTTTSTSAPPPPPQSEQIDYHSLIPKFGKKYIDPAKTLLKQFEQITTSDSTSNVSPHQLDTTNDSSSNNVSPHQLDTTNDSSSSNVSPHQLNTTAIKSAFYSLFLNRVSNQGDLKNATKIYQEMQQHNIPPCKITYNSLIYVHGKKGNFSIARDFLKQMQHDHHIAPDVMTYNCLIKGYVHNRKFSEARELIETTMKKESNVSPNGASYMLLIKRHALRREFDKMDELLAHMKSNKVVTDLPYYKHLLKIYLVIKKDIQGARAVLLEMKEANIAPDTDVYNSFLRAHSTKGEIEEIYKIFKDMKQDNNNKDTADAQPNAMSYRYLLGVLSRKGTIKDSQHKVFEPMKHDNLKPDTSLYTLLIKEHVNRHDDLEGAKKALQHMKNDNVPLNVDVFYHLLKGYTRRGDLANAVKVIQQMRYENVTPNVAVYNCLLKEYVKKKDVEGVKVVMKEMQRDEVKANHETILLMSEKKKWM